MAYELYQYSPFYLTFLETPEKVVTVVTNSDFQGIKVVTLENVYGNKDNMFIFKDFYGLQAVKKFRRGGNIGN